MLVRDIAVHYNAQVHTMAQSSSTMDFHQLFGHFIDDFYKRKSKIIEGMWKSSVKSDSIDIQAVRKFLDVHDKITRAYSRDCIAFKGRRNEYTCDWIQRTLLDFTKSADNILAITGPVGSGKSKLFGWVLERLQRPVGGCLHETFTINIGTCYLYQVIKLMANVL